MKNKIWPIGLSAGVAVAAVVMALNSCVSIPKGVLAVKPFDLKKYMGTWFEVARMDFRFEKNLSNVSAHYSLNTDGSVRVVNKGYDQVKKKWKESIGKAKIVNLADVGRLKVSFFGPFYAGYNIIGIDPDYQYVMVAGNNLDYLWLLSRDKVIPAAIQTRFLKQANDLGFEVSKLLWTKHDKPNDH